MSDDRAQRAADALEIRDVLARLALLADDADDLDEYMALYTEDAHWEAAGYPARRGQAVMPHSSNHLDPGERARAAARPSPDERSERSGLILSHHELHQG